jgi:hypothetical protein
LDRKRLAKFCFGLAVILAPLSYAVKFLAGAPDITWIDPTLVLSVAVFVLAAGRVQERPGWYLVPLAAISMLFGALAHKVEPDRYEAAWYVIFREPFQLGLSLLFLWACILYFRKEGKFAVKCVAWSAILQFGAGVYLYAAMLGLVPVPSETYNYLRAYAARQTLEFGIGFIPRMAGTFDESPLFGLFMLSCFVVLALELSTGRVGKKSGWVRTGAIVAGTGTIASFSDQVLLGLAVLLVPMAFRAASQNKSMGRVALFVALLAGGYVAEHLFAKGLVEAETTGSTSGMSLGERAFHAGYATKILKEKQSAIFFGIGPGRYGDYASATGLFPSTVTPQVMAIEWLIGYGLIGFSGICAWLFGILLRARLSLGILGIGAFLGLLVGNMFQARWLWEGWFLALAYLYAYSHGGIASPARAKRFAIAREAISGGQIV